MPMKSQIESPLDRAFNQQGPQAPKPQTVGVPSQSNNAGKTQQLLLTGMGPQSAMGQGNALTGHLASHMIGPDATTGGALGSEHGKKADNPWEAFIAGGKGAIQNTYNDPKLALTAPDPVKTGLGGAVGGVAGFAGLPGFSGLF